VEVSFFTPLKECAIHFLSSFAPVSKVFVMKEDFKFHCAHFVAFKGYRERLHGHNYTVGVRMRGTRRGHDGYMRGTGAGERSLGIGRLWKRMANSAQKILITFIE